MKFNEIMIDVEKNMDLIVEQYPDYHEQILKSALVYQYLHCKYFKLNMPINAIIELEPSIGLTGPGDGLLAKFLQNTLGWSQLIQTHSILHDAFGRFYLRHEKGRGYMYSHKPKFTNDEDKRTCYKGQISGLLYCLFNCIRI